MSWFKLPPERYDSPFNIQLQKFYSLLKIPRDQANLIPPDSDETHDYDIDVSIDGLIPLMGSQESYVGRPQKNTPERISKLKKRIPITKRQRQNVYIRCRNICEYCDIHNSNLQIHHKDGDATNNEEDNLMGCCPNCHKKLDRIIQVEKQRVKGLL